jgi:hypothetical protein
VGVFRARDRDIQGGAGLKNVKETALCIAWIGILFPSKYLKKGAMTSQSQTPLNGPLRGGFAWAVTSNPKHLNNQSQGLELIK